MNAGAPAPARLVAIGDTQETALVERLIGLEQNAARRHWLLDEIARRAPERVLHLGDLVTFGSAPAHWARLDALLQPLHARGIPISPVVGNHDRMLRANAGIRALRQRFELPPDRTWYRVRHHGLELLALDSNLTGAAAEAQQRWLDAAVAEADRDPAVRALIGAWHHPPMTNSRLVRPSRLARERFVPALARSRKALAVLCGHCHAYEHFLVDGLDVFVSGGGGGPRHRLETRPARRRAPDLFAGGPLRFLHFLEIEAGDDAVTVEIVRMSEAPTPSFDVADRVRLAYRDHDD